MLGKKPFFIHLHGDEEDARKAGEWWVHEHGGTLLGVVNATRELSFLHQGAEIRVDPNRVFTVDGIKANLLKYNCPLTSSIVNEVKKFPALIAEHCYGKTSVISLHNSRNFNVNYYLAGGECAHAAKEVHIDAHEDPHNLVIVTRKKDFDALKKHDFNVVLQRTDIPDYPGDLVELCFANGMRCFTVEVLHGHEERYKQILQHVVDVAENL